MTEGTYHGVFEGTDEDGFEHRTNGEGMESSFSKMKRLLLVELEKPESFQINQGKSE